MIVSGTSQNSHYGLWSLFMGVGSTGGLSSAGLSGLHHVSYLFIYMCIYREREGEIYTYVYTHVYVCFVGLSLNNFLVSL